MPEDTVLSLADDLLQRALALAGSRRLLPESTYRLQLHAGFTFRDACRIVPYLHDLGITHCYASPYLRARPGSPHGYDIVDHGSLNPEIGSEADYEAWVAELRRHGMGQILDTVPNHMGVATNDNAWWNDVLENGPASRYAGYFDIAWRQSSRRELRNRVLLPLLGEPYGQVLEAGQLRLLFENGAFTIAYYERRFPVDPHSYGSVLGHRLAELEKLLGGESAELLEYQSILTSVRNLPDRTETGPDQVVERQREKEVIKRRLAALCAASEPIRSFVEQNVAQFNGTPGDAHSFDLLDELLNDQCYRLSFWRVASDEINYRRFFDINELAALSMEREDVFEAAHVLILRLLAAGTLDGLRVDHPDGLYDPAQYFRRLQEHYLLACARAAFEADPALQGQDFKELEPVLRPRIAAALPLRDQAGPGCWPLYVVAEKILGADEPLPEEWAVHGTSGYDFVNAVNGLFVEPETRQVFTQLYQEWTQDSTRLRDVVYQKKVLTLQAALISELQMLTHQLDRLAQKSRSSRDFTFNTLRDALREVIACFPVYRSYISDEGARDADRLWIELAIRRAGIRNPLMSKALLRFVRDTLLMKTASAGDETRAEQRRFAGKFQQVTAPVTAKGIEDTAFYVYNRLVSLNEVGGEPDRFGVPPEGLHRFNQQRQAKWPHALSPLSTHDTKRSEDVRARIDVLSEVPQEWRQALTRWSALNERHRGKVEDAPVPDANEEYLLYQTLVGAWPPLPAGPKESADFVQRIQAYMIKALHEAKVHTSWINPNTDYDNAVQEFVAKILDESVSGEFLADFRAFAGRVSHYGMFNSLSQTLLKIACPGVPDTYQGTEMWDFSLVDPDNRRPVDYEIRAWLLGELWAASDLRGLARSLLDARADGRIKLYTTYQALHCRRAHPGLFSGGEYLPLEPAGAKARHLFAFARRAGAAWAIAAVPRLVTRLAPAEGLPLGEVWQDTRLLLAAIDPALRWRNVFTGEVHAATEREGQVALEAAEVFGHFPVALLVGERG